VGTEAWKASILSASPGVTMALLGALLIGVGLFVQPPIDFPDHPVYWVRAQYGKSGNAPRSETQSIVPVPSHSPTVTGIVGSDQQKPK